MEFACADTLVPAPNQALSPMSACVLFEMMPTSAAAPPPTEPPPPAPTVTSKSELASVAAKLMLWPTSVWFLLIFARCPMLATVCVVSTLTSAAPPTATDPAAAAPTANVVMSSDAAAVSDVAPAALAVTSLPIDARVWFSIVLTAAATPTPTEPPNPTPPATPSVFRVFAAFSVRLPVVLSEVVVESATYALAWFCMIKTFATPLTPTEPPTPPLKLIRLTSCVFNADRLIPDALEMTVPASIWLVVSLMLETAELDTPTPTLPLTAAPTARDFDAVSFLLDSATPPVDTTVLFAPMAVSVLSLNTLTAKAPATATELPAAPETASV